MKPIVEIRILEKSTAPDTWHQIEPLRVNLIFDDKTEDYLFAYYYSLTSDRLELFDCVYLTTNQGYSRPKAPFMSIPLKDALVYNFAGKSYAGQCLVF